MEMSARCAAAYSFQCACFSSGVCCLPEGRIVRMFSPVLLAFPGQIMLSEVEATHLQDAGLVPEAAQEVFEAGLLQWAPSRLGNGYQTWVSQVIHIVDVAHVLSPEGSLHTLVVAGTLPGTGTYLKVASRLSFPLPAAPGSPGASLCLRLM